MIRRLLAAGLVLLGPGLAAPACHRSGALTVKEAEALLQASPAFTTRAGSPVRRELVQVVSVRRIGRASLEVEFRWKDSPPPAGHPLAPLHDSMALFQISEAGGWELASLYKVD